MKFKHFFRKLIYGQPIIVVSGLPRSGTSMLMKMLRAGGVEIVSDGVRKADEDNPNGYYELERIKELTKVKDHSWLTEFRGKGIKIISYLLTQLPEKNNYKVIFIDRDMQEIIASQNKMLINLDESVDPGSDEKMIQNFESHLLKIKYILSHEPRFDVLYLNYNEVLNNPCEQVGKVNRFLGGRLDEEKMISVVNPDLYRNRK